ncbi:MAG: transcriptional regulator NrdR [Bifidobacteriaceae bacterium]|nr:transcriptional regulator NrdR [Bifidobacteriaceae bacterium]
MQCPYCKNKTTKVVETRASEDGFSIRRRRLCENCKRRFTTEETVPLTVLKRGGRVEPFDRHKVISGVQKACQGRPITTEQLQQLGYKVEMNLRSSGKAEIPSDEIGKAILEPLRDLDFVAYLRFASVYQEFESLDDFKKVITDLENYQRTRQGEQQKPQAQ